MKNTVHECEVDTRDEILQRIFDAARRVNDAVVKISTIQRVSTNKLTWAILSTEYTKLYNPFPQTVL